MPSSLRFRLPLLVTAVVILMLSVFLYASYQELLRTLLANGGGRAQVAADEIANVMNNGAQQSLTAAQRLADLESVQRCVRESTERACDPVRQVLATQPASQASIALWNHEGNRSLTVAGPAAASLGDVSWMAPSNPGITPLRAEHGAVSFSAVATVNDSSDPAGKRMGFVELRFPIGGRSRAGSEVINRFLGTGAVLSVGNRDGSVWTDLSRTVSAPAVDLAKPGVAAYRSPDTSTRLGAIALVTRSPWSVWVEFPERALLTPARTFLRNMMAVGLLMALAAGVLLYSLSWKLTAPLNALTRATAAIAAGEYTHRVQVAGKDEVARLASSFNAMTDQVEASHRELDDRVRQRTAELEAALDQLQSFSYSVSHDLRAPLRAISGFARILLEEHGQEQSATAQHYLERIAKGSIQMGRLVDDLLDFARLGRTELRRSRVDPTVIVREVLNDLKAECTGRDVRVSVAELPACDADPTLLKQVYANLLSNALKFTRGRTPAEIEVGAESHPSGRVEYFVRDNGVGFDMKYRDKLFGVFQRLHRADEFEGTGVGLAIVNRIVTRHDGEVLVDAAPGQGALFKFTLRRDPGGPPRTPENTQLVHDQDVVTV